MTNERCNYEWSQSDEELRTSVADCPHNCQLLKGHEGPHTCCNGQATTDD